MSRLDDIDGILTVLGAGATLDEVEYALRDYPDREVRAVLAERAAAGGGTFNGGTITEPLTIDASDAGGQQLAITDDEGNDTFTVSANDGAVAMASATIGGYYPNSPTLYLGSAVAQTEPILEVADENGDPVFRVAADGTVHIKAAGTVIADL